MELPQRRDEPVHLRTNGTGEREATPLLSACRASSAEITEMYPLLKYLIIQEY